MEIETKLALNSLKRNKKRTLYTTISLILCTALILTTILLISSIRNGVSENFDTEYNDYHIIFKNLSPERFNKIKNKTYIDKIYIQKSEDDKLEKVDAIVVTPIFAFDKIQENIEKVFDGDIVSIEDVIYES